MIVAEMTCFVDDCERRVEARGLCQMHYRRAQRSGDLAELPRQRNPRGSVRCAVNACDGASYARGWCLVHYYRWRRHGDPLTIASGAGIYTTDTPTYGAMHLRIAVERGPATDHRCVDCGEQAQEWSYNHADPDERFEARRNGINAAFSLDIANYEPRCLPCHRRLDATTNKQDEEKSA